MPLMVVGYTLLPTNTEVHFDSLAKSLDKVSILNQLMWDKGSTSLPCGIKGSTQPEVTGGERWRTSDGLWYARMNKMNELEQLQ